MPIETLVHLSLMALMVLLSICAAVVARKRSGNWLPRHRLIAIFGVCLGLTGIGVMISEKVEHGYPHFKSPHAILGLIGGILLITVPLLGFLGSKGLNKLRRPHRILARTLVIVAPLVLLTGVFRFLQLSKPAPVTSPVPAPPPPKP